ncbi:MAG TPA: glycosyltransferase family 2 protein [Sporichthya sp.]|nr:glycosyltransferase family 2 protein [Sporichthya sp.]
MRPDSRHGLAALGVGTVKSVAALALGRPGERSDRAVTAVGTFVPALGMLAGARVRRSADRERGLRVWARLPEETTPVGRGQAILVSGYVKHPAVPVARIWLLAAGQRRRMTLMPAHESEAGGGSHKVRMRGRIVVGRWAGTDLPVAVEIQLLDGTRLRRELGTVRTTLRSGHKPVNVTWTNPGSRVAICLATYQPHPAWLAEQLDSIRNQTHQNWVCLIVDDASGAPFTDALRVLAAEDPRFVLIEHTENVGAYRNFERAIGAAPRDAEFIAFCDQDDIWDPDKLEVLLARMADPAVSLVYSDMRLVDDDGEFLAGSFWGRRANKYDDLVALTTLNTVTGAASLMRAELVRDHVLPFPPAESAFHDHWTAVMALATGRIDFVDRPLYSYRQHESAVTGHQDQDVDHWLPSVVRVLWAARRPELLTRSERFHLDRVGREDLTRLATFAAVASVRTGDELSSTDRWWLNQLASADRRLLPTVALVLRARRYRQTNLGAERVLATGALWQALNRLSLPFRVPANGSTERSDRAGEAA